MDDEIRNGRIRQAIERAARFLPSQGPIDIFVAQNILQGFEDEPFEAAVVHAAQVYGTQPFLAEARYREEFARGRIRDADLEAVLADDLGPSAHEPLAGGRLSLQELLLALLRNPVEKEDDVTVRWTLSEADDENHLATTELWLACVEAVASARPSVLHRQPPARIRDLLQAISPALDTDEHTNPLLIRVCSAYLDQGVAAWPMPGREKGLLGAVISLYETGFGPTEPWNVGLPAALAAARGRNPLSVIAQQIDLLGTPPGMEEELIERSLLSLRGWAGMVRHFEDRPDRVPVAAVPARLVDFLALRLIFDRVVAEWIAPKFGHGGDLAGLWSELRDRYPPRYGAGSVARAFMVCQVARLVGLSAADIRSLDENEMTRLERAIGGFDGITRRRLLHLAYERRHEIELLDGLAARASLVEPGLIPRSGVQAIFCIDERCESIRRHLEETDPACETFGTAGFFGVPMYFHGIDDWHSIPLCPIVVRPRHTVIEVPESNASMHQSLRRSVRRHLGRLKGGLADGSRTLIRGGLLTAVFGAIAAVPLVARVAFPRLTALLFHRADQFTKRRIRTRLELERTDDTPLPDGTLAGFDVSEMAVIVRTLLEDIGLENGLARLVAVIGHGSTSLNNPHESAYDCGACGGGRGGPNARAFATMANDPRVRSHLGRNGFSIPEETVFVAAMHDTCSDAFTFYDETAVPATHRQEYEAFRRSCEEAGVADAKERCRRFDAVPLDVRPEQAVRQVEARAADLAQVRPEYGHATNAVCIVGRRARTRGLFLDRRAFLVSYDPDADADAAILARTLAAVGPVCSGINLAYMFSCIDPRGYGSGTKLPHNITGLIGVMDGHASDLRTGLPWQTVEIHEPVRLLFVIEAPTARIEAALTRVPTVARLVANEWVRLAAWDPATDAIVVLGREGFRPHKPESWSVPVVDRSVDWFAGQRGNLPPALIRAAFDERRTG